MLWQLMIRAGPRAPSFHRAASHYLHCTTLLVAKDNGGNARSGQGCSQSGDALALVLVIVGPRDALVLLSNTKDWLEYQLSPRMSQIFRRLERT